MLKLGKRPPEITEDAPFNVRVDLTGGAPNQTVARFVTSLPAAARDDVDVMLVLFMLLQLPAMRVGELASALQRSQSATEAVVQRMSDPSLDLIVPQDRRGGRAWRLSPRAVSELRTALRYRTVTHDEIDRKIIDWVRAKGRIDNKTLRAFFDLDVHGAAYRLRTLVNADVLQKLGQQKRGPGIQYAAGPKFPDARS